MDNKNSNIENDHLEERKELNVDEHDAVSSSSRDNTENEQNTVGEKRQHLSMPALQHNGFPFASIPASPPKFISLEQIMQAANGVTDMALVHEIAVNKNFKLGKIQPENSIVANVTEIVHKAFWDILQQELSEDPPSYTRALILLEQIKEELMGILLPHHTRIKKQIDEVLDLTLIQQQVENDALDFHYYAKYIISTMSQLCAPARDENIQELVNLTEIVPLYKGIFETLSLMKLDMANFTIQQFRPHIEQHSVEYERKKFQEFLNTLADLNSPVDGLEFTYKWFEKTIKKNFKTLMESDEAACLPSDSDIIVKAYLELLQWKDDEIFPETLLMDQVRFLTLRDQLIVLTLTASILLITYSIVGESIQGISEFKKALKEHVTLLLDGVQRCNTEELRSKLENVGLQVLKETNECLTKHGFTALSDAKASALLHQIKDVKSEQHSVRKLIIVRVLEFIEQVLTSSKAVSVKIPAGLSAFQIELLDIAGQFLRLVSHNRAVFGEYYIQIISKIKTQIHLHHENAVSDSDTSVTNVGT